MNKTYKIRWNHIRQNIAFGAKHPLEWTDEFSVTEKKKKTFTGKIVLKSE